MEIALIITSIMSISFLSAYISVSSKLTSVSKGFAQLFMAHNTLKETIDGGIDKDADDIHKENFIKFLSDSREWAFEYIENVQKQIKDFIDIADKQFAFFDSYGGLAQDQLFYDTMKSMSEEYKKLKALLPEEDSK